MQVIAKYTGELPPLSMDYSTAEAIQQMVRFFLPRCADQSTLRELDDMALNDAKWREAHALFSRIRAKTLRAGSAKDKLLQVQYCFEEICAKTLFNMSGHDPSEKFSAPFDEDSPFWVIPLAVRFARALGVSDPCSVSPLLQTPQRPQRLTMTELLPGYQIVRGSDIRRDGMYLELIDESTEDEVAEVFYSDATQEMTISVYRPELPLRVVEALIERAKRDLPPTKTPQNLKQCLLETLRLLASREAQLEYRRRVPIADVSAELFCMWDECFWSGDVTLRAEFSEGEWIALQRFHSVFERVSALLPHQPLPPVEQFIQSPHWLQLSRAAAKALQAFDSP